MGGATSQASKHSMAFHGTCSRIVVGDMERFRGTPLSAWPRKTAATWLWRGEAVMPMCKYYVDHKHKVAQGSVT